MIRKKDQLDRFEYLTSLSYIRIARSKDGHHFTIDEDAFLYPFNEYQTYGIEDARCTQIGDTYYVNFSSVSPMGVCDSFSFNERLQVLSRSWQHICARK